MGLAGACKNAGVRFFRRPRPEPASVPEGFWCAEAEALQQVIVATLRPAKDTTGSVPAQLGLTLGAEGRVVVSWHRRIVGFVPAAHVAGLRDQLHAAGGSELAAPGYVVDHEGLWRIWLGPPWPAESGPPPLPSDELEPAPVSILGFPLRGHRRERAQSSDASAPPGPTRPTEWILTVGSQSWDVREGVDLDVGLLRRRIAAAALGDTLHVRIGAERVPVCLDEATRVTLERVSTGEVEVLHSRSPS